VIDEVESDARLYRRWLREGRVTFHEARADLLVTPGELVRMEQMLLTLPEAAKQLSHRRRVWTRLVELLAREASQRAAPKRGNRRAVSPL